MDVEENTKKIVVSIVAIVALVVLGFSGWKFMSGEKTTVQNVMPSTPGVKSEKELAIEAQKNGGKASGEERDLSK